MGKRRQQRQPFTLDSGDVSELTRAEIGLVLRAAEDLIGLGGRSLLVKILRGSKAKDVLAPHRENPAYSIWQSISQERALQRVDWCIENGYLNLEYFGWLPLLVYRPKGLAIEARAIASEWLEEASRRGFEAVSPHFEEAPLHTLLAMLDQIAESGDSEKNRSLLDAWSKNSTKRLRARINAIHAEWMGNGPRRRYVFETCWMDESLGRESYLNFEPYAKKRAILCGDVRWVGENYPGISDVDIFRQLLLDQNACLVTEDRAFHNALCGQRIASFFLADDGRVETTPLPGVEPRGILAKLDQQKPAEAPGSPPCGESKGHPLYRLVVPESVSAQKKLRVKRRRIRNYFGGVEQMKQCSLTISWKPGGKPLLGIRLRVLPRDTGVKALDATEIYARDAGGDPLGAYIQAAALLIQLQLAEVPVNFFFDALAIPSPDALTDSRGYAFWQELKNSLRETRFTPIGERPRGPHMDLLRRKLADLASSRKTNEIVSANSLELAAAWETGRE